MSGDRGPFAEQEIASCRIGLPSALWSDPDDDVLKHCRRAVEQPTDAGLECVDVDDAAVVSLNETITFTVPLYEFLVDFPRALPALGLPALGWGDRIDTVFDRIGDSHVRAIIHAHLASGLISPAAYGSAIGNVERLRLQIDALFGAQGIHLLAYPTVARSMPHLSAAGRPELFDQVIRNTDFASNVALPSIAIPVAHRGASPVGPSPHTRRGGERYLLDMAVRIERIVQP